MTGTALEKSFHDRWAADEQLVALLPTDRVAQGSHMGATLPYVTVTEGGESKAHNTSSNVIREVATTVAIYAADYEEAKAIKKEVLRVFDNQDWQGDGVSVAQCELADSTELDDDQGVWMLELELAITAIYPRT